MNNDIVTKARLNAALGTEGNMGFEHNDIVTVDKMNEAIAEGGGGGSSDFSTAEVTIVNNGSVDYEEYITYIATFPKGGEGLANVISCSSGSSVTETCVLYKGENLLDIYGHMATIEGDSELSNDIVTIKGDCTITLTDAT